VSIAHTHPRRRRRWWLVGLLLFAGLGVGWAVERALRAPHPKLASLSVVAGRSLGGHTVVFSFGSPDYRDVWVLARGRLRQISGQTRNAIGGRCYGDPSYGGGLGPCYQIAEPVSVSPDGKHVAYFLQDTVGAFDTLEPALVVARADGSGAHRVDRQLDLCEPCSPLSPVSWNRNDRSLVVSAPHGVQTFDGNDPEVDTDAALYRVDVRSGRAIALTNRSGRETHNDFYPVVSPDGRTIAFLRSASREPQWRSYLQTLTLVYVIRANGTGQRRLAAPPRTYSRLWWCGKNALCATTPPTDVAAATYRINLRTGLVGRLARWPEAATNALSADANYALEERQTRRHRFEVLAGPVRPGGLPQLKAILTSSDSQGDPFGSFSVSRR
jgi:hypothetical protein